MEKENAYRRESRRFLDHLEFERGASRHTLTAYTNDLAVAEGFFVRLGKGSWADLGPDELFRYQASLAPPVAPATARRRVSSLRSLLKWLKREGRGPEGPLPSAAGIRSPKRLPKALSWDDMEKILATAPGDTAVSLRDRAFLELVYGGGLRVSEACGLRVGEVRPEDQAVMVLGKRGKVRWVPLPAETLAWLQRYLAEGRPVLVKKAVSEVFVGPSGRPMTRQSAYHVVRRSLVRSGVEKHASPHTLRHTYAVHLVKGGADLRAVQELLGHASIDTTQVYTQLDTEAVADDYRRSHPRK